MKKLVLFKIARAGLDFIATSLVLVEAMPAPLAILVQPEWAKATKPRAEIKFSSEEATNRSQNIN